MKSRPVKPRTSVPPAPAANRRGPVPGLVLLVLYLCAAAIANAYPCLYDSQGGPSYTESPGAARARIYFNTPCTSIVDTCGLGGLIPTEWWDVKLIEVYALRCCDECPRLVARKWVQPCSYDSVAWDDHGDVYEAVTAYLLDEAGNRSCGPAVIVQPRW